MVGTRAVLVLLALAAGVGAALMVGASAFGDTVCGTTGDISSCAQWGVDGYATRLAIENTGTQPISSFSFALPSGTTVTGVAGTSSCTNGSNEITCTITIAPGQTAFVDILSNPTPAVGSTGTLTMTDASGTQPGQSVPLQSSSVCANGTSTSTCTLGSTPSTSTSTSTSTPSTPSTPTSVGTPGGVPCQAKLTVTKVLAASTEVIKQHRDLYVSPKDAKFLEYEIFVRNDSNCNATGVVLTDGLPHDFDCAGGVWHEVTGGPPRPNHFHCKGEGRDVRVDIGALGADQAVVVEVSGTFPREHMTTNVAHATAANAPGAHSDHVHVDVVSKKQFEADKGKINH
jgi:hypothetical protein